MGNAWRPGRTGRQQAHGWRDVTGRQQGPVRQAGSWRQRSQPASFACDSPACSPEAGAGIQERSASGAAARSRAVGAAPRPWGQVRRASPPACCLRCGTQPRVLVQHHQASASCWRWAAPESLRHPSAGWRALSSGRGACPSTGRLGAGALAGTVQSRAAREPTLLLLLLGCRAPPHQLARPASSSADTTVSQDGSRTQRMLKTSGGTGCGV